MQKTLNLAQQLKEQKSQENEIIQSLIKQQQSDMRNELSAIYQQELNIMKADIKSQNQNIGWSMFKSRFLWPTLLGLSLCLGIFGGSWATMQYLTSKISVNYAAITEQNKKLKKLEPYNVEVLSKNKTNYMVLPKGAKIIDTYKSTENKVVITWEE